MYRSSASDCPVPARPAPRSALCTGAGRAGATTFSLAGPTDMGAAEDDVTFGCFR